MHVANPLVGGKTPYYPSDFLNAYSANGLGTTGSGSTTAIVIDTFPLTSDLTSFWNTTGVSQSLSNITFIQAVSGTLPSPSGEETLDAETSSSIAPAGKVRVYAAQSLAFSNLDTTFQKVISDLKAGVKITQVSISLGACETQVGQSQAQTDDNDFAVMSSLGATVFVSSGDSGSRECGGRKNVPAFYSTSPNVTAVGGTTLTLSGTQETNETAWSGSGGGLSTIFAKPSYQSSLSYSSRAVPDVAADADPNTGAYVFLNGKAYQYGGTSLAAPMWAGFAGLVNSARAAAGKASLGLLDSRIYPGLGSTSFRDITSGSNTGYKAGPGYDLVTGIGAPKVSTLLPVLVGQN
jgi:kumamolisin